MKIGSREVGSQAPVFIVAELSANHGGDLATAQRTVVAAAEAGADAIKIQTYTPETMTLDVELPLFRVMGGSPWDGKRLFELYQEAHTPLEWHAPLQRTALDLGLEFFSTAFDVSAVEFLEELSVPVQKIASFEIVDLPLIERMAKTGKPMIISTGMSALGEIEEAVDQARRAGAGDLMLLHCISAYPAPPSAMHLRTIPHLSQTFGVPVGLSDHTIGIHIPVAAVALGAAMIEKHFILDRNIGGPDADFSMEPQTFAQMVRLVRETEAAMGAISYGIQEAESDSMVFRRSLFVVEDLSAGDLLTQEKVRSLRPGFGLPPKYLGKVLGKRATRDLTRGTPLTWDDVGPPDPAGRS